MAPVSLKLIFKTVTEFVKLKSVEDKKGDDKFKLYW